MSLRRVAVILAVLAAVAVAGYTAYWFHVAGQLRKEIDAWADTRRAAGWQVEWSGLSVGGYPATLNAVMDAPRLHSPNGLAWSTARLTARASPFDISQVRVEAPGSHRLRWLDGVATATMAGARLDVDLTPAGRLDNAGLVITGLTLAVDGADPLTAASLAFGLDPAPVLAAGHQDVAATFSLSAQGVGLPPIPGLVLDRAIASAEASGRVMGALPAGPPAEAVAAWSAEGGTVELDRVALDWAPMALEADGTLAFDPALQPLVALSARVRGFGDLMDRLAAARIVDRGAASAAKIMLSLLSKPDSQGRPAIPVPITLQDGALYLGPARVGTVPPLVWPDQR